MLEINKLWTNNKSTHGKVKFYFVIIFLLSNYFLLRCQILLGFCPNNFVSVVKCFWFFCQRNFLSNLRQTLYSFLLKNCFVQVVKGFLVTCYYYQAISSDRYPKRFASLIQRYVQKLIIQHNIMAAVSIAHFVKQGF